MGKQHNGWTPTIGKNTPFYPDTVPMAHAIADFEYEVATWKADQEALDAWGLPLNWETVVPMDGKETVETK